MKVIAALTLIATLGNGFALYKMVELNEYMKTLKVEETKQTILGHRIGPGGQLMLVTE